MKKIQGINGALEVTDVGILIRRDLAIKNTASLNDKETHLIRWIDVSEVRFKKANALAYGYIHFIRKNDPPRTFWRKLAVPSWNHQDAVTFSSAQESEFLQLKKR